jgi:hypothetical protein
MSSGERVAQVKAGLVLERGSGGDEIVFPLLPGDELDADGQAGVGGAGEMTPSRPGCASGTPCCNH